MELRINFSGVLSDELDHNKFGKPLVGNRKVLRNFQNPCYFVYRYSKKLTTVQMYIEIFIISYWLTDFVIE